MIAEEDVCNMLPISTPTAYTESVQEIANKLCCRHLELFTNHKRAVVTRKKYTANQISKLKKTFYHNLFLGLRSPYIQPTQSELIDAFDNNATYSTNAYSKLAESIFNIQMMYGQVRGADKLQKCGDTLKGYKNEAVDNMLEIILKLSNYHSTRSEDMFLNRHVDDFSKCFQFDLKAFDLESVLQLTDWNNDFEVSEASVFTAVPGSHFSGRIPSWMKQERTLIPPYDSERELTLFGGLTNSTTSSLDVVLSLPDLPIDPTHSTFSRSRRALNESSVDEGFHELSEFSASTCSSNIQMKTLSVWDELSIWDDAVALEKCKVLSWECDGSYDTRLNSLYFCQLGKQGFDCMYNARLLEVTHITGEPLQVLHVDEKRMFTDTLYALIGVPSQTYLFCPKSCSMKPALNVQSPGLGIQSLHEFMCRFARVGTHYRQLCQFCEHHSDKPSSDTGGGLILNSFIGAIKEILQSYRSAYFVMLNFPDLTLLELWQLFEMFAQQLKFLADICLCQQAFAKPKYEDLPRPKFPMGASLLSYIYLLAVRNSSTEQYPLLLYIFKCISVPYIRFLTDWLFEGVSNDPYDEFYVQSDPRYLRSRDRHFWTQGFQLKQKKGSIPLFLDDLSDNIFACGKAINLLKVTCSHHYLFGGAVKPPPIDITFSSARFDSIEEKCKKYIKGINKCAEELKAKEEKQKLESQNMLKEKLQREKHAVESEIQRIEELELKVKVAIKEKKKDALDELKEQFEAAVLARQGKRSKQIEEDKLWIDQMKKEEDKKDVYKQIAKEEIIAYYEGLSRKAEQREQHARWIIERHELHDKRKEFLQREEEKINKEYSLGSVKLHTGISKTNDSDMDAARDILSEILMLVDSRVDAEGNRSSGDRYEEKDHEDALIDLSTPQNVRKKWTYDQSTSIVKSLMYPADENSLFKEPSNAMTSDLPSECIEPAETNNDMAVKNVSERIDCRGTSAKEAIYPGPGTRATYDLINNEIEKVEGFETKSLLYPGEGISNDSPVRARGSSALTDVEQSDNVEISLSVSNKNLTSSGVMPDGLETKRLLYPGNSLPADGMSNENNKENEDSDVNVTNLHDGQVMKSMLYSGELVQASNTQGAREFERPATMQSIIYPSEESERGIHKHDVKEFERPATMQSIIYPSEASEVDIQTHNVKEFERPATMQSIIYPSEESEVDIQKHNVKEFERPSTMQSVIYPSEVLDSPINEHRVKEFERPGDMSGILYPTENTVSCNTEKDIKEFEKPSIMQSIIYPSEDTKANTPKHIVKEFERASTMQSIIYPGGGNDKINSEKGLYREYEPPTRIKELMYPQKEEVLTAKQKFEELTHEGIWRDYIPEPYIDNYDILDMDPQSYCFPEIKKAVGNIFNNVQIDKDADLVKKLPLETVIKRSLTIPIQAQVSLVNSAIVKHFLEDLKIEDHFDAFRKFILLEDGEFGRSLCHSLFEKIALGMKPQKFCSSMTFTNIIPEALNMSLYASTTDYSRQLKFSLKWIPEVFNPSDVAALDFLELRYRVPWPCNIVITENSITKYNKVFSFLLRLKKASWSLQNVWLNLKRAASDRKAVVSPQIRQIHLFRHEMQHFVNNLERYIVNQIIHVSWREFHDDLRHVQSLDNLHKCHHHYLDKIIFRSLLSKNAMPVYNLINKMFGIIATFESRLLSQQWELDKEGGFAQHPLFAMLKDGHCTFHRCTGFLFSVISNLVKRGYQDHLDDLLLQVNFNTYYNTAPKR